MKGLFQRVRRPPHGSLTELNITPLLDKTELLQQHAGCAELLLHEAERSPHAPGCHSVVCETLQCSERHEVAEAVESLAPSRPRTNQPQAFPVAQTARLYP